MIIILCQEMALRSIFFPYVCIMYYNSKTEAVFFNFSSWFILCVAKSAKYILAQKSIIILFSYIIDIDRLSDQHILNKRNKFSFYFIKRSIIIIKKILKYGTKTLEETKGRHSFAHSFESNSEELSCILASTENTIYIYLVKGNIIFVAWRLFDCFLPWLNLFILVRKTCNIWSYVGYTFFLFFSFYHRLLLFMMMTFSFFIAVSFYYRR